MTKQEIAQKMAELVQEKDSLESKKSIVTKNYNDEIKNVEAQISELAEEYLHEEMDQTDMFDGISESKVITDESRMLNSGLELPEEVTEEAETTNEC